MEIKFTTLFLFLREEVSGDQINGGTDIVIVAMSRENKYKTTQAFLSRASFDLYIGMVLADDKRSHIRNDSWGPSQYEDIVLPV